jgi:hypothetical protein
VRLREAGDGAGANCGTECSLPRGSGQRQSSAAVKESVVSLSLYQPGERDSCGTRAMLALVYCPLSSVDVTRDALTHFAARENMESLVAKLSAVLDALWAAIVVRAGVRRPS